MLIIILCFACNLLDGMDVLIISFAAPAIAKDWNISPANLGVVFSSGLLGMTIGAVFLAPLADRFGRKPLMVFAGTLMAACIYLTSYVEGISGLMGCRFLSGVGIGTMMAGTAAMTAEYAPAGKKDFWVSLVVAGYPVGAVLTGMLSSSVIQESGWRTLFATAGGIGFLIVPLLMIFLKESNAFKTRAQPEIAGVSTLFSRDYRWGTLGLWGALFLSFTALYFLMSWIPKLASNAGLSMKDSIQAGTIFNLGAIVGIPVQGLLSLRYGLKKTISGIFAVTAVLLLVFGFAEPGFQMLLLLFLLGFGVQGGFVGLYALAAGMYPTAFKTTGVGWGIGMGRLGGIAGPLLGGLLVTLGMDMAQSFACFALPALLAAFITRNIKANPEQ